MGALLGKAYLHQMQPKYDQASPSVLRVLLTATIFATNATPLQRGEIASRLTRSIEPTLGR